MQYGLIGEHLGHSFSREVHARLGDYPYELVELAPEAVDGFMRARDFAAINVTIPYKETVIPYLDEIDAAARAIGAVNTVRRAGDRLLGFNTDFAGLSDLVRRTGVDLRGLSVLILGSGGTSKTAQAVCAALGAREITVVSRRAEKGAVTYEEAYERYAHAEFILNATPVGMYPDCESAPIDLTPFAALEGVVDVVYNPLATNLVLDAKRRGIKAGGGLYMLVMQAVVAVERFLDTSIPKEAADRVYASVLAAKENVVLTGMPGSGKSTVGQLLAIDGFTFVDTDEEIERRCGCTIRELIEEKGESFFRDLETEVIRDVSSQSCRIISTGGGAVLRPENVHSLQRNGTLFFLNADPARLQATDSRPLSNTAEKLAALYAERMDIYQSTADVTVPDMAAPEEEANYILQKRMERMQ